jgi:hypothetical protein
MMPSSSMTRSIRDAGMIFAPGGTSKEGKRRDDFRFVGIVDVRLWRISVERVFPNRSPDTRDKCCAAS